MDDQNKNLILATALSFLVILVWMVLFPPPEPDPNALPPQSEASAGDVSVPQSLEGSAAPQGDAAAPAASRTEALTRTDRVAIATDRLSGSISLLGGRIDDLHLEDYKVTQEEDAETVTLLSPAGAPAPYYAVYGWSAGSGTAPEDVPSFSTPWALESGETLTADSPVTLVWDNGKGLIFRRTISLDENFMFQVEQSVENQSDTPVRLRPWGIVARQGEPQVEGFWLSHEGLVLSADGSLEEVDYNDMPDFDLSEIERNPASTHDISKSGWIGFSDKYWMTVMVPAQGTPSTLVAKYDRQRDIYQTDMRLETIDLAPGAQASTTTNLFAGAKELRVIRGYQHGLGIDQFVDAIDWGWFNFITKPLALLLSWLYALIGNMGWAIIGLTLVIKTLLLPLAYKSYVSMAKMKELQPEMEKIKERAGEDRQKLQQEMMALYRKEKVNPASGCLPILAQVPIFFSLYKVLFVTVDMRHAPFVGWITDLSAPDPTSWMNLFGALPYEIPGFLALLSIGVWPILMGVTMWLQQKLNPAPSDPIQAQVFAWLPWIFMFMLGTFASGLVIYWVANNTITFIQQYTIMRSVGVKPDVWGNILGRNKAEPPKPKEAAKPAPAEKAAEASEAAGDAAGEAADEAPAKPKAKTPRSGGKGSGKPRARRKRKG